MAEEIRVDLAVLGGGPGGYSAAFRAADLGLSVCLIDERPGLGGVCLHVGCIPSKTLLHAAAVIEQAQNAAEFGLKFGPPEIDLDALRDKQMRIVSQFAEGLDKLCRARKIHRLTGRGVFRDPKTLLVGGKGEDIPVIFGDVIIATGSHPASLPDAPDDIRIWNSGDALALPFVPERLLIVGGGIIGLEMAQVYGALGSEITMVEMLDQIVPEADRDLVQPLFLKLKKKYRILTGTRIGGVTAGDSGIEVRFAGKNEEETGRFDIVLSAIGRRPNTAGIGLDAVGLEVDEKGFLPVNERLQTALGHFYAIGDVTGEPMLAHKASHQGRVAAEVIAGRKSAFTPMTIPSVAYTTPEIAWMGLTEKEAGRQGIDCLKGKFPWGGSGRALSTGSAIGVSKVLFDRATGRIIGAGICGESAGELIHEAVLAMEMGADAEDISRTVHAHPTLAETFARAAEVVDGSIIDLLPAKK
jgi:dihydrolipoamide dehydrogenase